MGESQGEGHSSSAAAAADPVTRTSPRHPSPFEQAQRDFAAVTTGAIAGRQPQPRCPARDLDGDVRAETSADSPAAEGTASWSAGDTRASAASRAEAASAALDGVAHQQPSQLPAGSEDQLRYDRYTPLRLQPQRTNSAQSSDGPDNHNPAGALPAEEQSSNNGAAMRSDGVQAASGKPNTATRRLSAPVFSRPVSRGVSMSSAALRAMAARSAFANEEGGAAASPPQRRSTASRDRPAPLSPVASSEDVSLNGSGADGQDAGSSAGQRRQDPEGQSPLFSDTRRACGLRPAPTSPPGSGDIGWPGGPQQPADASSGKRESTDLVFAARRIPPAPGPRLSVDSALERVKMHQTLTEIASLNLRSDSISSRDVTLGPGDVTDASRDDSEASAPFSDWVQRSPTPGWAIDPNEIEICTRPDGSLHALGCGAYAKVLKAMRGGVQPVAVKVFPMIGPHAARGQQDFAREAFIMKRCRDRNIVQFLGTAVDREQALLVTEFMEAGDLHSALRRDAGGALLWYRRNQTSSGGDPAPGMGKRIALDVARGLYFLHSHRIIHFDVKTPNVLMGRNGSAKVGDLGVAQTIPDDALAVELPDLVGTFAWTAPEMLMRQPCTPAVDIYSFGIVLWELVTGEQPSRGRMRPVKVPQECPEGLADLITRCIAKEPEARPTAKEVVDVLMRQDVLIEQRAALMRRSTHSGSGSGSGGVTSPRSAHAPVSPSSPHAELVDALVEYAHAVYGPDCTYTRADALAQGIAKDYRTYVDYIDELKKALDQPDVGDPTSASHARVYQLALSMRRNFGIKLTLNSRVFRDSRQVDLRAAAEQDATAPDAEKVHTRRRDTGLDHRPVLESMRLTSMQREIYVAARTALAEKQTAILAERQALVAQLQQFAMAGEDNQYAGALSASSALSENVEAEGFLLNRFYIHIMFEVLSPMQQACAEVAASPYPTDVVEIGSLLQQDARDTNLKS